MPPFVRLWFDQGRLFIEGAGDLLGLSRQDRTSRCYLAEPAEYGSLLAAASELSLLVDDEVAPLLSRPLFPHLKIPPNPHLLDLLSCQDFNRTIGLSNNKSKFELVHLLIATSGLSILILSSEESQIAQWKTFLMDEGSSGSDVMVLPLEEAQLRSPEIGHRFGLLLIDGTAQISRERLRDLLRGFVALQRIALVKPGKEPAQQRDLLLGGGCYTELQRLPVGAPYVHRILLYFPWNASPKVTIAYLTTTIAEEPPNASELWAIRRRREKLHELILRHRGRKMLVLSGYGLPLSEQELVMDLPRGQHGAILSLLRTKTLYLSTFSELARFNGSVDIVFLIDGPPLEQTQEIFEVFSRPGILYDLRLLSL